VTRARRRDPALRRAGYAACAVANFCFAIVAAQHDLLALTIWLSIAAFSDALLALTWEGP
jgi:hypothetical protein